MIELRQSTDGQEIPLGYFLDSTDGDTEETGLTINNTDIKIWKWGATSLVNKNSGGAVHMSNGIYYCTLDATDTDTVGPMVIFVHVSGALTVRVECAVLPPNVWDSKYGSDKLQVDAVEISGSSTAADTLEANIANLDEASSDLLDAIFNIGVAAASVAETASGSVITSGTESGTYENTRALDETYHTVSSSGGTIDYYYEFSLSNDAIPVDVHIKGRLHEGSTPSGQDSVAIYVYDWTSSAWELVVPPGGGFTGVANSSSSDDEVRVVTLFARHKDSSTGTVRIRFYGTSLKTGTALHVDQIFLTYSTVLSYNGIANAVLNDSFSLPGQEAPPAAPTVLQCLAYLYKAWRNKVEVTSSTAKLYDDAGTTVDQKWNVDDDGTTFTKGEVTSGP